MQFNSFIFILLFLPTTVLFYFLATKINSLFGKIVIIVASIIFYAYSGWSVCLTLGISVLINYLFVLLIVKSNKSGRFIVFLPIAINIGMLLYFKYLNFTVENVNLLFDSQLPISDITMPLGISFFTFQQIAYLVAIYRKELKNHSFIDYLAFILYFPKIAMGPLCDPAPFISQLNDQNHKKVDWNNIASGVKVFSFGLFKKVMIADIFSKAVSWGFDNLSSASSLDLLLVTLFYTFEIYFDFSSYCDMAVGSSLMLNISLPMNFDSPYKALSVRDFWKRWHISLSAFFTKYLYIPLGGNREGKARTYINIMIVFLISGIWHGSNWTFILWGILHGCLMIFDRHFDKLESKIWKPIRWLFTFIIINILWLLFRAESVSQWKQILTSILSMKNTTISDGILDVFILQETTFISNILHISDFANHFKEFWMVLYLLIAFGICLIPQNNYRNLKKLSFGSMLLASILFVWGLICLSSESVFVYFGF